MRKRVLFIVLLSFLESLGFAQTDNPTMINIIMTEQSNPVVLGREASWLPTKKERRDYVVKRLKRQAEASQRELVTWLTEMEQNGLVFEIRPLWIVNSVNCYANESVIHEIEKRKDVLTVYPCERLPLMEDAQATPVECGDRREIAENLLQVNANQVWELGFSGEGVLIGLIDTGTSLTHADLQGRFWDGGDEYPNHGYDFGNHDNDPSDENGHGTHVAGTICGTGVSGTRTGVAPDAKIMVLKVFNTDLQTDETLLAEAMQFAMEHGADLLNMSLGWPDPAPQVKLLCRQACENTLAAGIVASVCAGNIRHMQSWVPIPRNIYTPGDCPPPFLHEDQMVNTGGASCVISVGAVDFSDEVTYFSSVGPSVWTDVAQYNDYPYTPNSPTEIGLIRPDLCAPGLNIKSLDYSNDQGYSLMDGTSMATPCVSGTIALMLSKNHELTPEQIDQILESTAVPLSEHKSNDFGSGRIDALAAVNAVAYDHVDETTLDVRVFPNPAQGMVTIACDGMRKIEVYTLDGKLVKSIQTESPVFQLHGLPDGTSLVKITTDDSVIVKKIVRQ